MKINLIFILLLIFFFQVSNASSRSAGAVDNIPITVIDYCTATISGTNIQIPCLQVNNTQLNIDLAFESGNFVLESASASSVNTKCAATFSLSSQKLYVPCLRYNSKDYSLILSYLSGDPKLTFQLAKINEKLSLSNYIDTGLKTYNYYIDELIAANESFAIAANALDSAKSNNLSADQMQFLLSDYINSGQLVSNILDKLSSQEDRLKQSARKLYSESYSKRGVLDTLLSFIPDTNGASVGLSKGIGDTVSKAKETRDTLDEQRASGQISDNEYRDGISKGLLDGFGSSLKLGVSALIGTGAALIAGGAIAASGGSLLFVIGGASLIGGTTGLGLNYFTGDCDSTKCTLSTGHVQNEQTISHPEDSDGTLVISSGKEDIPVTLTNVDLSSGSTYQVSYSSTSIEDYSEGGKQNISVDSGSDSDTSSEQEIENVAGSWSGQLSGNANINTSFQGQAVSNDSYDGKRNLTIDINQNKSQLSVSFTDERGDDRNYDVAFENNQFEINDEVFAGSKPQGVEEESLTLKGKLNGESLEVTIVSYYKQSIQGMEITTTVTESGSFTR